MTNYKRRQFDTVLNRISEQRDRIQVLSGPRQVGKSTLMDQVLEVVTIPHTLQKADSVNPGDTNWIHRIWESVRLTMRSQGQNEHLLVIDEIQKIHNWSEAVKLEWDWDTSNKVNIKLILLGSSRLMLSYGLNESLAGRFELIRMPHWSYPEMRDAFGFSLDEYIYFGGYPGSAKYIKDNRRWKNYIRDSIISPAIEKDVILTSNIYKPALMRQVFDLGCNYSAELLSLTKMVAQLQDKGNVTTAASYISILDKCQLLCGLQKYAQDDSRKYNSIPKFQVYNNALLSASRTMAYSSVHQDAELWGRWVESAVGTHFLSKAEELGYKVYYWRERAEEVDFILSYDNKCIAFEVKSGRRASNKGLSTFSEQFHPAHTYVIGTGGLSLTEFLSLDMEDLITE